MRLTLVALGLLSCASAVALLTPARAEDCRHGLVRVASVDMDLDYGGRITVPVTIDGHHKTMLIDTGGLYSSLNEKDVLEMNLAQHEIETYRIWMFGGTEINHYVIGDNVEFGGLKASRIQFIVFPGTGSGPGWNGSIAPDILRSFDADFDFANAKFNLISPDHCEGKVVYWTKSPAVRLDAQFDRNAKIKLPVTIDGHTITIDLDTGSAQTYLSFETAKSLFGFDEKSPDLKVARKDGDVTIYRYPFKSLTFGDADNGTVTVNNPDIDLIPDDATQMAGSVAGLLAMNIIRRLHLYIAYKEHHLYLTPASAH